VAIIVRQLWACEKEAVLLFGQFPLWSSGAGCFALALAEVFDKRSEGSQVVIIERAEDCGFAALSFSNCSFRCR
jgi:hypothetical protein